MINLKSIASKIASKYIYSGVPEIIFNKDGSKEYRLNGLLHREDGPAVEYANGRKEWYLNGREIGD